MSVESLHLDRQGLAVGNSSVASSTARRGADNAVIRALDVFISASALVALFPVMIVLFLAVRLDGGPGLFSQARLGRSGHVFKCLKFRSMAADASARLEHLLASDEAARREWAATHKLTNDPRITRLGAVLRATSLDELPQLLNILRGEMSLVGPRPVVPGEIVRYGRGSRFYFAVRPGLTGLWQVMGRNDVSYSRRVALDRTFVRRRSISLYFFILLKTVPAVLGLTGR